MVLCGYEQHPETQVHSQTESLVEDSGDICSFWGRNEVMQLPWSMTFIITQQPQADFVGEPWTTVQIESWLLCLAVLSYIIFSSEWWNLCIFMESYVMFESIRILSSLNQSKHKFFLNHHSSFLCHENIQTSFPLLFEIHIILLFSNGLVPH